MTQQDEALSVFERWPGYTEQSWSERFAYLDRLYSKLHDRMQAALVSALSHSTPGDAEVTRLKAELRAAKALADDHFRNAQSLAARLATPSGRAQGEVELRKALAKIMPIRVHDGPDYAEVYFADGSKHSTQAMTMNPQDWLDIQAAYDAAPPAQDQGEGR